MARNGCLGGAIANAGFGGDILGTFLEHPVCFVRTLWRPRLQLATIAAGACLLGMPEPLTWTLTVTLMLVGLIGVIVPLLPGTTLILIAAILHKLLIPTDLSWMAVGFVALFWLFSVLADFGGVILGTRLFGGSKWGMAGASGGAFVGIFISLPALLLGTIFGAMAAEKLLAKKSGRQSLKAGIGAATGFIISTFARCACAMVMIALFAIAVMSGRT